MGIELHHQTIVAPVPNFSFSSTAEEVTDGVSLVGKTVVVTGFNSGIGLETARVLAKRGAFIIGAARTLEKAERTLADLGIDGAAVACELSEPASVRAAVQTILGLDRRLDVIICNAGIMALPERHHKYGIELQFLTNHVGHFIFATGLVDALAPDGRVVVVSSGAHHRASEVGITFDDLSGERSYEPWERYGQSKLANILFARSLQRRFDGTSRVASSLHPGVIKTNLGRNNPKDTQAFYEQMDPATLKSIPQGAATQCLLAARPEAANAAGRYYADCQPSPSSVRATDDVLAERLWQVTEEVVAGLE